MPTTLSGVNRCLEPSRWERNSTPSSRILRRELRLKTWKPPLSVRMAPGQEAKPCRTPCRATSPSPGRR